MKAFKKTLCISLSFLICLSVTGCYDSRELDNLGYIMAIGVDKTNDLLIRYTFQIAKPLEIVNSSGGDSEEGDGGDEGGESKTKSVYNVVVEAPDIYIALNLLSNFVDKEITISQTKFLIYSSELAREGLKKHLQYFIQEAHFRPDTLIGIALDDAEAILKNFNPALEANPSKYYELLSKNPSSAYGIAVPMHKFVSKSEVSSGETVLPLFAVSKLKKTAEFENNKNRIKYHDGSKLVQVDYKAGEINKVSGTSIESIGMAAFKNFTMVQELAANDVFMYNLLSNNLGKSNITVKSEHNPNATLSFSIKNAKPPVFNVKVEGEKPKISAEIDLYAEITDIDFPERYSGFKEIEGYLGNVLKEETETFLTKTAENDTDILMLGNVLKRQFLTWSDWEKENWRSIYKNSEFDVSVKIRITRSGMILPVQLEYKDLF